MKHVVLYSGGASSAYMAYLVVQEQKKEEVVLLHTPTFTENHDADTFRCRVARRLGVPITEWGDGRNLDELLEDQKAIPGQFLPFCTVALKQKMKEEYFKYLKSQDQDFIEYVGFGMEEEKRVYNALARARRTGRTIRFPIYEKKIPGCEIKRIIEQEWKIPLPKTYKNGLNHNNCIPCYKAGKASWRIYWEQYPERYWKAAEYEKRYGYTVFKDCSLSELAEQFEKDKAWEEMQYHLKDYFPCEHWM